MMVATEARDLAAVDLWTERALDEGWSASSVARWLESLPERRERMEELARADIITPSSELDSDLVGHPGRPLGRTVDEYARQLTRAHEWNLQRYANSLVGVGDMDAALKAMEEAAATAVGPGVFRSLADRRLAAGDSTGAARAFAVVASDPLTTAADADSLAGRAGLSPESDRWRDLLAAARGRILPRVLADTVRYMPESSGVSDADGNWFALSELLAGQPTVLVFWATSCGPCIQEVPDLLRLNELAGSYGVQVLSVTVDDVPGARIDNFIEDKGITYPVYFDLRGETQNAFAVSGIPANFVLDAQGRVRFAFSEVAEVALQLEALAERRDAF